MASQRITRQTLAAIEAPAEVITTQIIEESGTLSPENSMIENKIERLESQIRQLNEEVIKQRILSQQLETRMMQPIQQFEKRMEDKVEKNALRECVEKIVKMATNIKALQEITVGTAGEIQEIKNNITWDKNNIPYLAQMFRDMLKESLD